MGHPLRISARETQRRAELAAIDRLPDEVVRSFVKALAQREIQYVGDLPVPDRPEARRVAWEGGDFGGVAHGRAGSASIAKNPPSAAKGTPASVREGQTQSTIIVERWCAWPCGRWTVHALGATLAAVIEIPMVNGDLAAVCWDLFGGTRSDRRRAREDALGWRSFLPGKKPCQN